MSRCFSLSLLSGSALGIAVLLFEGCGEEVTRAPSARQVGVGRAVTAPAPSQVTDAVVNPFAKTAEDVVQFRPLRDPFRSAYERARLRQQGEVHPLQRYNIQQLRVVGIIWGIPRPLALVTTPDGKEYQVSEGTPVGTGDGKVAAILHDRVVIVERYYDYRGQLQSERFELLLKKE